MAGSKFATLVLSSSNLPDISMSNTDIVIDALYLCVHGDNLTEEQIKEYEAKGWTRKGKTWIYEINTDECQ